MLNQQQIDQFKQKARNSGYSEAQIANEIARKNQELTRTTVSQPQPTRIQTSSIKTKQVTPPQQNKGFIDTVSGFLLPRVNQFVKDMGGTITATRDLDETMKRNDEIRKQQDQLMKQAKAEADATKRQQYYKKIGQLNEQASGNVNQVTTKYKQDTGIDVNKPYEEQRGSYGMQALGVAGEVGSYLIPVGKIFKGAGIVSKITNSVITGGAITGAVSGLTTPKDISFGERLEEGAKSAAFGAATGGVFKAAGVPLNAVKNFVKGNESRIYRLFKITPAERMQFRKSTGNMDFAEQILLRDGKNLAGKSYDELVDYFSQRKQGAIQQVADTLENATGSIDKTLLIRKIQSMRGALRPEQGNVGQKGAQGALDAILEDLQSNPNKLTVAVANRIKQQLQDAGDAAFSATGNPSPASEQLANVSRFVKELIEKEAPQIKEQNGLIQLYSQAKTSIERTGDREANKISNDIFQKFMQTIPAAVGASAGLTTGNIYNGIYGFLGASLLSGIMGAGRVKYFTPEFQTRVISMMENAARSQKLKNSFEIGQRVGRELEKILIVNTQSGLDSQVTPTQAMESGMDTTSSVTDMSDTGISEDTDPPQDETVQIRNKKTGEIQTVPKSQLNQFGINEGVDQEGNISGLPSKKDILAAMFLDVEKTGGKNLSLLNTLLTAYEKVDPQSKLSAQEKTAIAEATTGLNLLGEIQDAYTEIQNYGLTAQSGGLLERARGAAAGNWAAVTQEGREGEAAAAYANAVNAFMSRIARAAGEKGVLTDYDLARISKSIPKFGDAPGTAARQFAFIESIIQGAIETRSMNPSEVLQTPQ